MVPVTYRFVANLHQLTWYSVTYRFVTPHFSKDRGVVVHPDGDHPVVVVGFLLAQVLNPGHPSVQVRGVGAGHHLHRPATLPHLNNGLVLRFFTTYIHSI